MLEKWEPEKVKGKLYIMDIDSKFLGRREGKKAL